MKYKILITSFVFFSLSLILILSVSPFGSDSIKLGTSHWIGYAFLYYINDKKEIGNQFNTIEFNSASEVLRAYRNGVINALCLTKDEVLKDYRDEDSYTIVMAIAVSEGADVIISRDDIKNPQMLKGKRVGLEDTALGGYILRRFLEINSMNEGDLFIVHLEPQEHYKSFADGIVDAIVTYEPIASRILREIGGNVIFSSREIPGEIYDLVLVRRDFLLRNKKIVKDFIDKYFEVVDDFFSDKSFYLNFMAENYRISREILEKTLENKSVRFLDRESNIKLLLTDQLERNLRMMERYFSLRREIDYSKLLDRKILLELYGTRTAKNLSEI